MWYIAIDWRRRRTKFPCKNIAIKKYSGFLWFHQIILLHINKSSQNHYKINAQQISKGNIWRFTSIAHIVGERIIETNLVIHEYLF